MHVPVFEMFLMVAVTGWPTGQMEIRLCNGSSHYATG